MSYIVEFIRKYYAIIILSLSIIIIFLTVLISLLKKDKDNDYSTFALSKEKKKIEDISIYKNKFIIFRDLIQNYSLNYIDENQKSILKSIYYRSNLESKNIFNKIKESIENKNYLISETIDNKYIGLLFSNKKIIARTGILESQKDIENILNSINIYELSDDIFKSNHLSKIDNIDKINRKFDDSKFHINIENSKSYIEIFDTNNILLFKSFTIYSKNEIKSLKDAIKSSINRNQFYIEYDDKNDSYRYILVDNKNELLGIGFRRNTYDDVLKDIKNLTLNE